MSSSSLENEDLDNVPLVRMEDVQPSRDRAVESRTPIKNEDHIYETCIIDNIEYENECIVNDDEDSNIGSMVSLQSEDVYEEDSSSQELIIPEVLEETETENDEDEPEVYIENDQHGTLAEYIGNPLEDGMETEDKLPTIVESELERPTVSFLVTAGDKKAADKPKVVLKAAQEYKVNPKEYLIHAPSKTAAQTSIEVEGPPHKVKRVEDIVITPPSESWPTLEILPGGVIKNTDKYESDSFLYSDKVQETVVNTGEMMYACAKCSQTFKYLFCLVKHVKWHEDQTKIMKNPSLAKLTATEKELVSIKREQNELDKLYKKQKIELLAREPDKSIHLPTLRQKENSRSGEEQAENNKEAEIIVDCRW